jgi:hypothetical protein
MGEYALDKNGNSLVADTALLAGAVMRKEAELAAVIALLSLGTVPREVT